MSNVRAITTPRSAPAFNPALLPRTTDAVAIGRTYRAKLTAERVDALPLAPDGVYIVKDTERRGLELRVTRKAKTFYCRARMGKRGDGNNRAKPVRLGTAAELEGYSQVWSLYEGTHSAVRTQGRDFNAEHAAARAEHKRVTETPAAYWERYKVGTAAHGRNKLRDATVRNYAFALQAVCDTYWTRPMDALTPAVVVDLYAAARDRHGVATARSGLKALRALQNKFDLANTTGKAFKANPEARRKPAERIGRIAPEQAPTMCAWLANFAARQKPVSIKRAHADMFQLAMLMGLRDRPMRALRWDWLDLQHGIVKVPKEFCKNGLPAELPLSAKAVEMLTARQALTGDAPHVFPSMRNGNKPMANEKDFWTALPYRCSMHDARRVLGRVLTNGQGVDYPVVKALLTHADNGGDITALYTHATPQAMREAVEKLARVLYPEAPAVEHVTVEYARAA